MRIAIVIAALVAGLAASERFLAQEPLRLSVDVSLVTLNVEVVDANDRPVTTLKKEDFQVYENGALQEIRSFDSVDAPYNVMLLFDCSPSTEPEWPFLVEAMNTFTKALRPQDRIAFAQFGSDFKILQKWFARTGSPVNVTVQPRDPVCSGTDFYGAVKTADEELQMVKGRKGVVVLSDGTHVGIPFQKGTASLPFARFVDASDDAPFQKLVRSITNSSVVFYFVAVDTDLNPARPGSGAADSPAAFNPEGIYNRQQVRARLEQLAAATGGRVVFPNKPEEVVGLYERMARDLGTVYSLGYPPPPAAQKDTYRKIEVRVRDRSMRVRQSRDGYRVE